jgi:hypothetical protein
VHWPDEEASLRSEFKVTAVKLANHPGIETQEDAAAFQRAGNRKKQREDIKRLALFSTEFGLMRENGDLKAELASYFDTL